LQIKTSFVAALLVACGMAHAQSSVTVYGRVDVRVMKDLGTDNKTMANGSGSRLGFRGEEDLGGGLKAFFDLQHRFNINNGAQTNAQRFYQQSFVGLAHKDYGRVWLGRDYTPAYIQVMLIADPFDHANVGSMININQGGPISTNRVDSSINYQFNAGPVTGTLQVSEATNPPLSNFVDRPMGMALLYKGGPLTLGYGYENPGNRNDVWHHLTGVYVMGPVTARVGYGTGKTTTAQERSSLTIGATYAVGAHRLHAAYGVLENDTANTDLNKKLGLGWQYFLSTRTNLYVNYGHDSVLATKKSGYDLGIKHNF
jgi:predicted porin